MNCLPLVNSNFFLGFHTVYWNVCLVNWHSQSLQCPPPLRTSQDSSVSQLEVFQSSRSDHSVNIAFLFVMLHLGNSIYLSPVSTTNIRKKQTWLTWDVVGTTNTTKIIIQCWSEHNVIPMLKVSSEAAWLPSYFFLNLLFGSELREHTQAVWCCWCCFFIGNGDVWCLVYGIMAYSGRVGLSPKLFNISFLFSRRIWDTEFIFF